VSNGHVRIELPVEGLRPGKGEPVEPPNFVRAVLRAEEGSDATIVDLIVQALDTVVRCEHGAHRFAGGVVAMLAQDGNKADCRFPFFKKTFNTEPGHLPSLQDLFSADEGDVILSATRHDTRSATDASIKVDDHDPPKLRMVVSRIEIFFRVMTLRQG